MFAADDIGAVVADIGSSATRIGFAGEDVPRAHFATAIGCISSDVGPEGEADSRTKQYHFDVHTFRPNMSVQTPVQDGLVTDWDAFERLWNHALGTYLRTDLRDSPVLLAEKPFNSPSARHKLNEVMFETFGVSATFLSKDAVLSCYACGKTSGLVVDAGASCTVVSAVQDGWVDAKSVNVSLVGGRLLDSYVGAVLKRQGIVGSKPRFRCVKTANPLDPTRLDVSENLSLGPVHPTYDALMNLELGRDFKESVCRMADSALAEGDPRFTNLPLLPYELPDGTQVDVGIERFLLPELYIDPSPILSAPSADLEVLLAANRPPQRAAPPFLATSLPSLMRDSVLRSDPETQTALLSNMILMGGSSCFEGMSERLRLEVERLVHASAPGWRVRMTAAGVSERALSPWLGGSILASLGSFHEVWVSRTEYEEFGAAIVDRKCP